LPSAGKFKWADIVASGTMQVKLFSNGARHFSLGAKATASGQPVSAGAARAELTKELMTETIGQVYHDINNVTSSLRECLQGEVEAFRGDLDDLNRTIRIQMKQRDYSNQFSKLFVISQDRLRTVLQYFLDSPELTWLASLVEEGLHTCLDIGSLTPIVSEESIDEVVKSLPYVNEWWSMCTTFSIMAKSMQHHKTAVPFNARYRTEVYLAQQFLRFYKATMLKAAKSKISLIVRPYVLRVQNFLNLAAAVHYHTQHGLAFPHRQGGRAVPRTGHGFGAVSYARMYSLGRSEEFPETCRFCRKDGEMLEHYGCWEELALSFDRCVSAGGIYYNATLQDSNVYSCHQDDNSVVRVCGGRPQQ